MAGKNPRHGPGWARLGVAGTLADPTLTVQAGDTVVAENDDWRTLDGSGSILPVLNEGNATGVALIDVYEVEP